MRKLLQSFKETEVLMFQIIAVCYFIYGLITGDTDISIACGIFGIINTKKPMPFNYSAFGVMGIANDSRGGDSCGVFIDGNTDYGTYKTKYFADHLYESKVLAEAKGKKISVALGHCRKASTGMGPFDEAHAQPVVLTDKSGKVNFVMIHNGTIFNYKELAKKYIPTIDIKDMTDSQVMARIFYYAGYQALSEYYGGAVFFIIDYRLPDHPAFIFQGKSKKYNYVSSDEELERPFYFVHNKETGEFAFSSIFIHLDVLYPDETVYTVHANNLCKLTSKGFFKIKEFPRDKVSQTLPVSTTSYSSSYTGSSAAAAAATRNWLNDEDEYNWHYTGVKKKSATTTTKPATVATKKETNGTDSIPTTTIPTSKTNSNIESTGYIGYIQLKDNIYVDEKGKAIHGRYYASKWGSIFNKAGADNSGEKKLEVYFFNGILLDLTHGNRYFSFLERIQKTEKKSPEDFRENNLNLLYFLSACHVYLNPKLNSYVIATSVKDSELYTGDLLNLGANRYNKVVDGVISTKDIVCDYDKFFEMFSKSTQEHLHYKMIKLATLCQKK